MLGSAAILSFYLGLKGAAYCAWCAAGLRRFQPARERLLAPALALGLLRLVLGGLFGVGIFLGSAALYAGLGESAALGESTAMGLAYLGVYVPVRWIEWGLIEALLRREARSLSGFWLGADRAGRRWRLGGAALSCLADVPMILSLGGLPLGRFLC